MGHVTPILLTVVLTVAALRHPPIDWKAADQETLRHFQALLKFDTSDPPGHEKAAVDYLKQVLEAEGIPVEILFNEANRPNLVARLRGSGAKRPLLIMGHTEGGSVTRTGGKVKFASVQTLEKIPRGIELTARGPAGHGSTPLRDNAVVRMATAVAKIGAWKAPVRLNDTTRAYFERLASISTPEEAKPYRAILSSDPKVVDGADEHFLVREPRHASMIRTSISPNIIQGGYRINVIPSEAKATLDVRMHPDDDHLALIEQVKKVIGDSKVEVAWAQRDVRPGGASGNLASEAFKAIEAMVTRHYQTVTLPTMSPGASSTTSWWSRLPAAGKMTR